MLVKVSSSYYLCIYLYSVIAINSYSLDFILTLIRQKNNNKKTTTHTACHATRKPESTWAYGLFCVDSCHVIPMEFISVPCCNATKCWTVQWGEYLCKALYTHSPFSFLFFATDGPEISCGHHFIVQEDTYFTPNCTVNGFPQITENWYKDEDDILSGFPRTMYRNAAGNYTLIASNNYSNVSHVIQIEVWCKCTMDLIFYLFIFY